MIKGWDDRPFTLWEASTGDKLRDIAVSRAKFSADGSRIIGQIPNGNWVLYDGTAGAKLADLTKDEDSAARACISSDSSSVALVKGNDSRAFIYDATKGRKLAMLRGHDAGVCAIAFGEFSKTPHGSEGPSGAGDSSLIVTGSRDGTAMIWDAETREVLHTLPGHDGDVLAVAFSSWHGHLAREDMGRMPMPQFVATGSADGKLRLWDAESGQLNWTEEAAGPVDALAFSRSAAAEGRIVA